MVSDIDEIFKALENVATGDSADPLFSSSPLMSTYIPLGTMASHPMPNAPTPNYSPNASGVQGEFSAIV